jgi:signal transduction histidine kinase
MARTLRLLLIEDSKDDALFETEALRQGGYAPDVTRVDTPEALKAALESGGWDAVIADYNLPSFTGIDALRIVQATDMDVPLLLVSGAVGEELAAAVLKAGFHDFILKENLSRLAQVMKRELREAEIRRERTEAVKGLLQVYAELEQRVVERTAELQAANAKLRDSRLATLNLMEDAVIARKKAEETSERLRLEIIERKHAEAALRRSEEQLKVLNDDLERKVEQRTQELQETQLQYLHAEKLTAIGKMSASIAHEFNNPLQGIMTILKGLKKRAVLEPEDRELLEAAIDESERMKNLIRSLQEFNRPSSGKKVPMDVQKTIDSILLLQKSDFRTRRISVELNYAERLPPIHAIPDQIKQVFLNLLTNAADACLQRGGVITVSTWQEDKRVAVAIKDSGIGIEQEKIDLLFQPFYTTKPDIKGTGLGLSVSHGIIKHHQGEIRVESRPGEGSTFTVLLPV